MEAAKIQSGYGMMLDFPIQVQEEQKIKEKKQSNKKAGVQTGNYAATMQDVSKLLAYFKDNNRWIHYLLIVTSCNMARRNGDMLSLQWFDIYNSDGSFRNKTPIYEEKTGKISGVYINDAVKNAVELYTSNVEINVAEDDYSHYVFEQKTGTHPGTVISYSGCLKALKRACEKVGIKENLTMHGLRRFFGSVSYDLHPNDHNRMEILQDIFNHSSERITRKYIGITDREIQGYYNNVGDVFESYVIGGKEILGNSDTPVVNIDSSDLRSIIKRAYEAGMKNSDSDVSTHIDAINEIMGELDKLVK